MVRAVQTAELLAGALGLRDGVSVEPDLADERRCPALLKALRRQLPKRPIAIVGHEPGLSHLWRLSVGSGAWPEFKKSSVFAFDLTKSHATARFHIDPRWVELHEFRSKRES